MYLSYLYIASWYGVTSIIKVKCQNIKFIVAHEIHNNYSFTVSPLQFNISSCLPNTF